MKETDRCPNLALFPNIPDFTLSISEQVEMFVNSGKKAIPSKHTIRALCPVMGRWLILHNEF